VAPPGALAGTNNRIARNRLNMTNIDDVSRVKYRTINVDGLNIAYRECGCPGDPKLVLFHGFPSSSHQYRNLIRILGSQFHVIAPDYPGFGLSDRPDPSLYQYTFDKLAEIMEAFLELKGFDRFGLYAHDYGSPIGFRILGRKPELLEWLIIQNCSTYEVGLSSVWDDFRSLWSNRAAETERRVLNNFSYDAIKSLYLHGASNPEVISPDNWESDYAFMLREHSTRLNLDLLYDYRLNIGLYSSWQLLLRTMQPKTLIFWGQNDVFLKPAGGEAYLADLPNAEMHRLDTGHFALEDNLEYIAHNIRRFYTEQVASYANGIASRD